MVGRPRQFDIDGAIDTALRLFIEKGYEGASFADLVKAMGISPPSFYAAFGSKEELFRRALERYAASARMATREAMAEPTARAVVQHLLLGLAKAATEHPTAKGCLLVQGALVCSDNSMHVRDDLRHEREAVIEALTERFAKAQRSGDKTLPGPPAAVARLTSMILTGIATQAASGVEVEEITRAVQSYVDLFG
jgi:AcrR family transcriptional regulator